MSDITFENVYDLVIENYTNCAHLIRQLNRCKYNNPDGIKYASEHGLLIGLVNTNNLPI